MSNLTLTDLANMGHGDEVLPVINVLSKRNQLFDSARWLQANGQGAHVYSVWSDLGGASARGINEGITPSKGTPSQKTVNLRDYATRSEVDKTLIDFSTNPAQLRSNKDMARIAALSNELAKDFIYGSGSNNTMKGLEAICNGTNGMIIDGDGDDSEALLTSIYMVQWQSDNVYFAYPSGVDIPIEVIDLGLGTAYQIVQEDIDSETSVVGSAKPYAAYISEFHIKAGLAVEDPRTVARIANVNSLDITGIEEKLVEAVYQFPTNAPIDIYMHPKLQAKLAYEAYSNSNINYTPSQVGGVPVIKFHGVHDIRQLEAISLDEEAEVIA